MRKFVVKASKSAKKGKITAATSEDMLRAFENKLAEFGVESNTKVTATEDPASSSREVEIYDEDYNEMYKDFAGGFSGDSTAAGEIYSLAEVKDYWNKNNLDDYVLEDYPNFETWWKDTRDNYMERC